MKLSSTRIEQALKQIGTHTVAVSENHPMAGKLHEVFGDHTFFLDDEGLEIVEAAEFAQVEAQAGELVQLALWDDASRTTLAAHRPKSTGVIVVFDSPDQDKVDRAGEDSFPASDPTSYSGSTSDDKK
jgi:hypothetical protein